MESMYNPHDTELVSFRELWNNQEPIDPEKVNPAKVFGARPKTELTARPPKELLSQNRRLAEQYAQADRRAAKRAVVAEGASVVAVENIVEAPIAPEVPTLSEQPALPEAQPQTPNDSQA
jgi:hypothetical protein